MGIYYYIKEEVIEMAAAREHSEIRFEAQFTESESCLLPIFNVRGSKEIII